jgi:DNA-binding NarL/FixJ family response regulator
MQPITVAIADSSRSRRLMCVESLRGHGIDVVAQATTIADTVVAAIAHHPSVIVCGMDLGADVVHSLLGPLQDQCSVPRVVLVTESALGHEKIAEMLLFASFGFVARKLIRSQLAQAVRAVHRGEAWVPRKALGLFAELALP